MQENNKLDNSNYKLSPSIRLGPSKRKETINMKIVQKLMS